MKRLQIDLFRHLSKNMVMTFAVLFMAVLTIAAQEKNSKQPKEEHIKSHLDMTKFVFQDTSGNPKTLDAFKGKYILLDIWASWCRPCINEFPVLDSIRNAYGDKNLVVVQLSCDREKQRWVNNRFWHKRIYNQLWLGDNRTFMEDLKVATIPRYMLIDKKGRLLEAYLPKLDSKEAAVILSNLKRI